LFGRWKRSLTAELARITHALHGRRVFHKDLYLCHFYVSRADVARPVEWRGRVHLIDLHRLAHHPWTLRVWQVKDLAQMLYSSEVIGVDPTDRLRFWRSYWGETHRGFAARWVRSAVLWKYRRYRRHNMKRLGLGL
jgi:heptose I phosphotransferase